MIEHQLTTLGLLFLFAIVGSAIAKRFKQPVVIGLLIIGTIIGPHLLNLVHDAAMTDIMIEFGAIIFLFLIGLEFSVEKLLGIGLKALIITILKVGIMFIIGYTAVTILGGNLVTAVFAGIIISFSSTMISMNVLKQRNMNKRQEIPLLLAVLILEDIMGVIALTVFASMRPGSSTSLLHSVQKLSISIAVLITLYIILSKTAETIIGWLTKNTGEEAITFISLGLCAGFAYTAFALGLSPSAGAFLAGSIVSNLKQAKHFEQSVKPHGLMLTSLFFISVGTTINLANITKNIPLIIALTIAMLLGMQLSVGIITRLFANYTEKQAFFSSVVLLPLGVFALLLAKESTYFNTNMDLLSITSVLVLIMAIIMSVSVNKADAFYERMAGQQQPKKSRISAFAHYLSESLDELTIENTHTRKLKKRLNHIMRNSTGTIAVIISLITAYETIRNTALFITTIIIGTGIITYLVIRAKKHLNEAQHLLITVLSGMEGGTTRNRTRKIIIYIGLSISLTMTGLFFPFITFTFGWPTITSSISVPLIGAGIYTFLKATNLLRNFTPDLKYRHKTYRKLGLHEANGQYLNKL